MKIIIVGGVAGGATAAARIRRLDESAEIIIFERSGFVSYANCGLPYFVGGVITDPAALTLQTPESFRQRFRIDVRVRQEVTAIDPAARRVTVRDLAGGGSYTESYDRLLLSPGANPVVPALPGLPDERVFTLRTVEDTLRIRGFVEARHPASAVLVGGGFIGLEMAENLRALGLAVTIVERSPQLLGAMLDSDMASFLHAAARSHGIGLRLGCAVTGFSREGGAVLTECMGAPALRADMVILAVGVAPDTALAADAGLRLGARGAIAVNERMETSAPGIYAVGDAVEVTHTVTGRKALVPLAGPANKQGRIAADNICGGHSVYAGAQGSSILKLFEMTAAATGIGERAAQEAGIPYGKVVLSPASHAGYYPGGRVMTMKVLYHRETLRLLGAQIVGYDGVDKRIDVLATALFAGLGVVQLKELELAYAPPFSAAKDPVNMAGFLAENVIEGRVKQFFWDEADRLPRSGSVTLLDVRTPGEYSRGHLEGFVNLPLDELRARLDTIPATAPVYVICQSGLRSYLACRILSQNGFDCYNFSGGYRFYESVRLDRAAAGAAYPCGMDRRPDPPAPTPPGNA